MNTTALEIKNLSKHYKKGFSLENVSLTLPSGCIMGLIGKNGAGKSTIIRLILDMLRRDSGTITILGRDNQDNFTMSKENIGVVLDEVGIPQCMTAGQVGVVMANIYRNWDHAIYASLLQRFSLPEKPTFKEYSKGMRMKLGLAIALSHHPKLLILDEATAGLDPLVRDELMDLFREFTRDPAHSILISSHIVSDLEKICDYIAFLHNGRLLLCEEKDALLSQYCMTYCAKEVLDALPASAVLSRRESPYGVEALVLREALPEGLTRSPVTIEELFIAMMKEAN